MSQHDLRFALRSVRYLRSRGSTDADIRRVLRDDLGCPPGIVDELTSLDDTAVELVAA